MTSGPLSGVKVVELATVVASPTAARVMCDFGAEVIKIETPAGDAMRRVGTQERVPCEDYKNPLFTLTNNNKRLVAINLKTDEGRAALLKLLEQADVFLSNVRPRSLQRLGLDYETLKQRFPRLVYAHFSAYGPEGAAADNPGFDITAFWLRSGPISDWRTESTFPMTPTYAFGDMATSSAFLSGVLMALIGREKSGRGTLVRTSLYSSAIWCNSVSVIADQPQFEGRPRFDPLRPVDPFSAVYLCADGRYIGFYRNEYEAELEKFARLFGMEDILDDPRYRTLESLYASGVMEEAVLRLRRIFLGKTSAEWHEILTAHNVSNEIARPTAEVHRDEQALANRYLSRVDFRDGVSAFMPAPPIQFADYEPRPYKPTGKIGEDTDAVFAELGYAPADVRRLREEGVIR